MRQKDHIKGMIRDMFTGAMIGVFLISFSALFFDGCNRQKADYKISVPIDY